MIRTTSILSSSEASKMAGGLGGECSTSSSPRTTPPVSHHGPAPARRNKLRPWLRHRPGKLQHLHFTIFILLACCLSFSSAYYIKEEMVEDVDASGGEDSELFGSAFASLAKTGTIVIDQRPPPVPGSWRLASEEESIVQRRDLAASPAASHTASMTSSSSSTTESPSPLPSLFDSGYSSNITTSCSSFISNFLSNSTFKSCYPLSLLLQNSQSFFQAERSLVRITQTLDATCAADLETCTAVMNDLASNITSTDNCASDLSSGNPLVEQTRLGFISYPTLYKASCLRNPATSSYCFADAITNSTNPTDSYIYYLPLNSSLPGGSLPTCSSCLQNTMAVYDSAAADRSQPIASTYVGAAQMVDLNCGPTFVNASLPAATTQNAVAPGAMVPSLWGTAPLLAVGLVMSGWL
ncbi:hypothetical protein B7463_g11030, partial [Scytalidium lignicola]